MIINSLQNKKIKEFSKLHNKKYRDQTGLFLVCDNELALSVLDKSKYFFSTEKESDNIIKVTNDVMKKLSNNHKTNNVAVMEKFNYNFNNGKRIVIVDDVADPNNLALILESMNFFEYDLLILSKNTTDVYQDKVINKAKESFFKIKFIETDLFEFISKIKKDDYHLYVTGLNNISKELNEISPALKYALVFGNEAHGVSKEIMNEADEVIKIAMSNLDSLNVAMAATITMHHFNK